MQEQLSRRTNRRIASYATICTTQKTDKKTSELSKLFRARSLTPHHKLHTIKEKLAMFDTKSIDDIANRLADVIPSGFSNLKEDMEKNFHAILQSALGKLDLVTREEFEVQKAVLAKTRSKLEDLEKTVAEIEQQQQQKK